VDSYWADEYSAAFVVCLYSVPAGALANWKVSGTALQYILR